MAKLTSSQIQLLADVAEIAPANTHQIAKHLGHRQSYETHLRNRLFRLADRGLVIHSAGPRGSRVWQVAEIAR